jgi:hypothetical protein
VVTSAGANGAPKSERVFGVHRFVLLTRCLSVGFLANPAHPIVHELLSRVGGLTPADVICVSSATCPHMSLQRMLSAIERVLCFVYACQWHEATPLEAAEDACYIASMFGCDALVQHVQGHCSSARARHELSKCVAGTFLSERYCDVTLKVTGDEVAGAPLVWPGVHENEEEDVACVKAHKAVLCAFSPVFDAMLSGRYAESNEVLLHDVSEAVLHEALCFCYTGHLSTSEDSLWERISPAELLLCAHKFELIPLAHYMCFVLGRFLDAANVVSFLTLARSLQLRSLAYTCERFLAFQLAHGEGNDVDRMCEEAQAALGVKELGHLRTLICFEAHDPAAVARRVLAGMQALEEQERRSLSTENAGAYSDAHCTAAELHERGARRGWHT